MATCIHGTHWDGVASFYCDRCAVNATGSLSASPFVFTVVSGTQTEEERVLAAKAMSEDLVNEAKSLLTWLDGWGDGPNWSDASGATVPVVKASLRRVLDYVIAHPPPKATEWFGVWAMRDGYDGHWHQMHDGSRGANDDLETTEAEARRTCAALNESARERTDSLGWRYEVRPYPSKSGRST